jgi:hypothetical protein
MGPVLGGKELLAILVIGWIRANWSRIQLHDVCQRSVGLVLESRVF